MTAIEWTDATWNPVTGCDKVSPGCDHCYAEGIALRDSKNFPAGFAVTLHPERLDKPLHWRAPRRVFVNSMSDMFHDKIPDDFIEKVWDTMGKAPQHTFQILTKRPGRMRSLAKQKLPPLPNVWLGVSAEDQRWADIRIPLLLDTPAAVRFISAEPLLGPIDLTNHLAGLDWVIAGGESGPQHRRMDPNWPRSIRDQCVNAGTAFLFKQWGGRTPKSGGRELDGRTWDEYPTESRQAVTDPFDVPDVDPVWLATEVGVDITNCKPIPPAADTNAREQITIDDHPSVRAAFDNPVLKSDGVTVDCSATTWHIAAVCGEAGLSLEAARWVVDQRDDLAARVAEFLSRRPPVDDVKVSWEKARDRNAWMTPGVGPAQAAPTTGGRYDLTDARIGAYIADTYLKPRFLITKDLGWMEYDGKRWAPVGEPVIGEAVRQGVLDFYNIEANAGADHDRLKAISGLFSAGRIFAIVRIAKGYLWAKTAEFDSHPDLFNVNNGVVNLRDGSLRPHDRTLLFTKLCPTDYIPGATHADWTKTLAALPDDEVRTWLQYRLGQSITGYTTPDDVLVFLEGSGENGKSTAIIAVQKSAGPDYVVTLPERVLLANPGDHPTELMTLRGARLAFMEELPDQHLNIKRLKDTQGGTSMSARYCGKDSVAWEPTHSIFVTTNHKPRIDEPDHAVWRRLAMVVFPYRYRKPHESLEGAMDRRGDPGLRERMRLGAQGRHEAVLTWLVNGAVQWYQNGQQMPPPPATIEAAKEEWRNGVDVLLRFACDELVPAGIGNTTEDNVMTAEMFAHFGEWLKAHGHSPWSDQTFTARFEAHRRIKGRAITKRRLFAKTHARTLSRKPVSYDRWGNASYNLGAIPPRYSAWHGVRFRLPNDSYDAYDTNGW